MISNYHETPLKKTKYFIVFRPRQLLTTGEAVCHQSVASLLPPLFKVFAKLGACLAHSDPGLKTKGTDQNNLEDLRRTYSQMI